MDFGRFSAIQPFISARKESRPSVSSVSAVEVIFCSRGLISFMSSRRPAGEGYFRPENVIDRRARLRAICSVHERMPFRMRNWPPDDRRTLARPKLLAQLRLQNLAVVVLRQLA